MKTDEKKSLSREEALIKVLERFAKQIDAVESRLNAIEKLQRDIFSTAELFSPRQDSSNTFLSEIKSAILRYHSEMGKIVSAQDYMSKNIETMTGRHEATATRQADILGEQENLNKYLINLSDRFEVQEKTAGDHYGFSIKLEDRSTRLITELGQNIINHHGETEKLFTNELKSIGNKITKLHGETEKLLIKEQKELQKYVRDFRLEVSRKMLAFDGIEEALAILLHRTEPPEPKPPIWPIRVIRKIRSFFRLLFTRLKNKQNTRKTKTEHRKAGKELTPAEAIQSIDAAAIPPDKLDHLYKKGYEIITDSEEPKQLGDNNETAPEEFNSRGITAAKPPAPENASEYAVCEEMPQKRHTPNESATDKPGGNEDNNKFKY